MQRIYSVARGRGPAVILVHGWAASHRDWDGVRPHLVQCGYRVYALDLLGHGRSEKPGDADTCRLGQIYTAFCQWVDSLALVHPFALVGHSMGGYVSLRYAVENPARVTALGLVDPLYAPEQLTLPARQILQNPALLEKILRHVPQRLPSALTGIVPAAAQDAVRDYGRASPYIAYALAEIPSLENMLNRISQPTMLLYGSADLSLRPSSFQKLQKRLPALADCFCIPGAGHTPHITHTDLINGRLVNFLNRFAKKPATFEAWGPNRMALDF
ncbi:MAG: alpha/beta fold hydrolase [Chloroflexota bacterium]